MDQRRAVHVDLRGPPAAADAPVGWIMTWSEDGILRAGDLEIGRVAPADRALRLPQHIHDGFVMLYDEGMPPYSKHVGVWQDAELAKAAVESHVEWLGKTP